VYSPFVEIGYGDQMLTKIHRKSSRGAAISSFLIASALLTSCGNPPKAANEPVVRDCPPCPAAEPASVQPEKGPGPAAVIAFEPKVPVALPPPRLDRGLPLMRALAERKSGREFSTDGLDLQTLSELVWSAWGINRPEIGKRTAPSARNWQDMKLYVVLASGAFLYDAAEHVLVPKVAGDLRAVTGKQDFVGVAPLNLVYVSDYEKMSTKDEKDQRSYAGAHAGFMVQNVYLYCASEGLTTVVRAHIDKAEMSAALQLPENEHIVLAQTVGWPAAPGE